MKADFLTPSVVDIQEKEAICASLSLFFNS
jgi:hypothetical protein